MSLLFFFGHFHLNGIHAQVGSMGVQSTTQGMLPVAIGINSHQVLIQALGQHTQSILVLLHRLETGDPFTSRQMLSNKLSEEVLKTQMLMNSATEGVEGVQALRNEIVDEPLKRVQVLLNRIIETDYVQGQQRLLEKIGDVSGIFQSTTYDIYLDNRKITNRISQASIQCDEANVHNTIEMSSIDKILFERSNPFDMQGESRIEVQVGNRVLYFLLEKRSGDEMSFSLWGRSLSAREDTPYADAEAFSLSAPTSAQEVVEGLPTYCAVTWECDDWVLPESFNYSGTPIEGILEIANTIGAIVRSDDDGTIIVRNKFPTRPVNLNKAAADLTYDRDVLLQGLSYQEIPGERYNTIEVFGSSTDDIYPSLQIEENDDGSAFLQGDPVFVRAYWDKVEPPTNISTAMTAPGTIYQGISYEKVTETVEFHNGVAMATYPVVTLQYTSWTGGSLGDISVTKYGRELIAEDGADNYTSGYGIAEITYQTTYNRYMLYDHDISALILILTYYTGNNIDVLIRSMGSNDTTGYEAPTISDLLLTNDSVAVLRGLNFLDEHKYDRKIFGIRAPYNDSALDGKTIFLNDGEIGCSGNFYIASSSIIFRGPKVLNEMRVVQWQV